MIGIILGLIIAFIVIIRSFKNVIKNDSIHNKNQKIHLKSKLNILDISQSTFKTASKGILLKSIQLLIYFFIILYFSSLLIWGISNEIGRLNISFMKQEFNILMIIFFITLFLKYGLETNWIKFKKQVKKEIIKGLNLLIIKIYSLDIILEYIFFYLLYD